MVPTSHPQSARTSARLDDAKKLAALAATLELPNSGVIGLGTGSTARHFVEAVGALIRDEGRRYTCVCTSERTRAHALSLGIPLAPDDGPWTIDVTVDGADEVDDDLDLSKGAGGALTREKIVSHASRRTIIVCDATKRVRRLGETRPIALEILAFGGHTTLHHLRAFGEPTLRAERSDANNLLVDLALASPLEGDDKPRLDRALRSVPGVVETGLFLGRASLVLVAAPEDAITKGTAGGIGNQAPVPNVIRLVRGAP